MDDICVSHNYTQRDLLLLPPSYTPPVVTAAAAPIHTYPRAAAAAVAATILFLGHRSRRPHSVEIPPKTRKTTKSQTKQNTL
jgi:hypothetical protein